MRVVMVDFDTSRGTDFGKVRPIGVFLASPDGKAVVLRYRPEDEEEPSDNYFGTMTYVQPFLDEWRHGFPVAWSQLLVRMEEQTYLGLRFRTVSLVPDEMTVEEAFERFVVKAEPLPVVDEKELPSGYF